MKYIYLILFSLILTGCYKSCEDKGGKNVAIGTYTYFITIMVGNIPIMSPVVDNVYQCQDSNGRVIK